MLLKEKLKNGEIQKINKKNHIKSSYSLKEEGITLIALVITIIVLLILARSFTKYGI